jgi:undecaprenyl-diphosphatase
MQHLPFAKIRINIKALRKEFLAWLLIGIILFSLGKWLDKCTFKFFAENVHNQLIDQWIIFLTEKLIYIVLAVFAGFTLFKIWKNEDHKSKAVPALFAVFSAAIASAVLKSFFAIPRPFITENIEALISADFASFPSGHTAVAFALLIPIYRVSKLLGISWALFALLIGFARVYEFVHYPSDIAGGIFFGGIIGAIFSHPATEKLLKKWWKNSLEFRRQSFHFIFGFLIVFAHWIGALRIREIGVFLTIGLILIILTAKKKLPILENFLKQFERKRIYDFPGSGPFYFLLAVGISFVIFPIKIAYAAILILSVGDSLNHIIARNRMPKRFNFPWNRRRSLLGVFLGIFAGFFAAQFFVPWYVALIASTIAIFLETFKWRIGKFFIDDNLIVPLTAGFIMWVLS